MRYGDGEFVAELGRSLGLSTSPRLIRSNTNLVYDCGDLILRLTPNSFRSAEEVERELHWLRFVASHTDDVVHLSEDEVRAVVEGLSDPAPQILSLSPSTLAELWESISQVAEALDVSEAGRELVASLKGRLTNLADANKDLSKRPRVSNHEEVHCGTR